MNEPINKSSRGFYIALLIFVAVVLAGFWPIDPGGPKVLGPRSKAMSNLRQIGLALQYYAIDHEGRLPKLLAELEPEDLAADSLPALRFRNLQGNAFDWLYYPKADINTQPAMTILAASPRAMRYAGKEQRIVLHCDISVTWMPEADFQKQLVEELRVAAP